VTVTAYLGLGSNLGDRLGNLQAAVDALGAARGVRPEASSRVWETAPVGGPPQPDYLNAVVRIDTDRAPGELLRACRDVEDGLGRVRTERWGARTIDVDVLLYDDESVDTPELTVPHPRLASRAFVVLPLLELDPELRLPDGRRLVELRVNDAAAAPYAPPLTVTPRR
jgi:2-amino-4-hydroxy-6-hydroxymethyldihydropteridine diphosphokinase